MFLRCWEKEGRKIEWLPIKRHQNKKKGPFPALAFEISEFYRAGQKI